MNKIIKAKSKRKEKVKFSFLFPYLAFSQECQTFKMERNTKSKARRFRSTKKRDTKRESRRVLSPQLTRDLSKEAKRESRRVHSREVTRDLSKEVMQESPPRSFSRKLTSKRYQSPPAVEKEEKKESVEVKRESEECVAFKRSRFNTPLKRRPNTALQVESVLTEESPSFTHNRIDEQLYASEILPGIMSSQIPGISFKRSCSKREGNTKEVSNDISEKLSFIDTSSYTSRSSKIQEHWETKRKINIDAIISRKCKNYDEMMAEYYRRSGISDGSKLFIFDSQDTWIKKVLLRRGWVENPNKSSKAYHLLWSYRFPRDLSFPKQKINHYPNSDCITSKTGLQRLLRKYRISAIQPLTFDLDFQRQAFEDEFNKNALLSKLQHFLKLFVFEENPENYELAELEAKIKHIDAETPNCSGHQLTAKLKGLLQEASSLLNEERVSGVDVQLSDLPQLLIKKKTVLEAQHIRMVKLIRDIVICYQKSAVFPSSPSRNVWIVKSKNGSKGAGIFLSADRSEISKQQNRLVQKYIENPLILAASHERKFDLRMWVLATGSKHLRIFYNQDFYGRICFSEWSTQEKDIKNELVHLTNYTVNRDKYQNAKDGTLPSVLFPDHLFREVSLARQLDYRKQFYQDVEGLLGKLVPLFKEEVCGSTSSSYFQLFGVDLLVDASLNIHLLEVNMSARCEERHPRLTAMLEDMGEGLLNILEGSDDDLRGWKSLL